MPEPSERRTPAPERRFNDAIDGSGWRSALDTSTKVCDAASMRDETPTEVSAAGAVSATFSATAHGRTRNFHSSWLLRAAKRLSAEATALEDSNDDWADPHARVILETVAVTVITAFTFLEAVINEVLEDAAAKMHDPQDATSHQYLEPLGAEAWQAMAIWWVADQNDRESTLGKYKQALKLANRGTVGGIRSYDDARALKILRDALAHYRPTWSDDEGRPRELEDQLAHRYQPSTLIPEQSTWWDTRALSAGCARWACASAEKFADDFADAMGIELQYQRDPLRHSI